MLCADKAYQLSSEHGFDPSRELQEKQSKKDGEKDTVETKSGANEDESLLAKTGRMFRTSPTLAGLFGEVITFQSLSTVLNVCFVRQLKESIPADGDRAAYTGQFYAGVNGISSMMQFFVLPLLRKYLEPQWVYRFLPMVLMPLLTYAAFLPASANNGLWIASLAFFALKSADYSIRGIATELVYQPLDFDARYLGKEVIGVFANRFGKSGTSMILSGLTGLGLMAKSTRPMSQLAVGVGGLWSASSIYLSRYVVTNRQAEEQVRQRSGLNQKPTRPSSTKAKPASKEESHEDIVNHAMDKSHTNEGRMKED
jgi:ATP/ADP translocase